jgi:CheY-like chemotaxis protein
LSSAFADQAPASARFTGRRASKALRILVVDDNEDAALLLADVLSGVGHHVKTGGDAVAALKLAHEFRPEVAILDIGLPVMDGHALAARLRAELGAHTPRLIAVTGYGQRNDRRRSEAAGFDAHLVKPVDVQQLLALLEESESPPPSAGSSAPGG